MRIREAVLITFLGGFLALGALVSAGVMAKGLPTTKTLQERLKGAEAGFQGSVESGKNKVAPGTENDWDHCVDLHAKELSEVFNLHDQTIIIVAYYEITGGSEESSENFDKWVKDFEKKGQLWIRGIEACYDKSQLPIKGEI